MAEITKLNITELDFDTIKTNLKDYFASQSEFTDHDFNGSAISVMLDVLAYNTHYNAYYMNMLASEAFLDSAQLRNSVVAKAGMLGYTPRSSVGSKANVAIIGRPTQSVTLYNQMAGRVTRGKKAGGKRECKVVTVKDPIYGFRDLSEGFTYWEELWN